MHEVRRRGADWEYRIMASNIVKRQARRAATTGFVGAATLGAFLVPAAPAAAKPVSVPGVGTVEIPNEIPAPDQLHIPGNLPGMPEPTPPPFVTPTETVGEMALDAALSKQGAPYVYGASGPDAFDCSGLVKWAYEQAGHDVPRTSDAQLASGSPVSVENLEPGDVVSFYGGGHSGLYAGDGNIVHASTAGTPVQVAPIAGMPVAGASRL